MKVAVDLLTEVSFVPRGGCGRLPGKVPDALLVGWWFSCNSYVHIGFQAMHQQIVGYFTMVIDCVSFKGKLHFCLRIDHIMHISMGEKR